ncbi:Rpn family recombination-promoting nuclease/putative transposase [Anabaena sp. CCY 0017]|uniref:Rpn family recombination-promoting nuclease/putative transposase n=1 Tax=Anabaena sp. CCY 0017 TaxID=3103866 RepID=UPI0039C607CF
MIDHDRLFKELLTTFFVEFLELFLPEVLTYLERDSIQFLDKEVFTDVTAGERYEADLIVKAKFLGQDSCFLIHVENQSSKQASFDKRMFRYFSRLYEKFDIPVYPIVLLSYDSPKTPETNVHQVAFPHKVILQFNYDVIQLNQLNWRDFLRQKNPVATALMAKMNIAPAERRQVKFECLRLLATLKLDPARMRLISGFIDTYLRLSPQEQELLQDDIATIEPRQQEEVMEIVTSWMEEGMEKATLSLVMRQLPRRVGTLTPELEARVQQLSLTQLEDLSVALLDFSSVEDLTVWLEQISVNTSN